MNHPTSQQQTPGIPGAETLQEPDRYTKMRQCCPTRETLKFSPLDDAHDPGCR
jgi:hypothetical protein